MSERTTDLEAKVAELADALRQLERRIAALERGAPVARRAASSGGGARQADAVPPALADLTKGLSLGGRTLLVLAGAFVLRALTDSNTLPAWLGVALGFLYAGTWIGLAERAGKAGQVLSAGFHGLAAVAVGFPLLFEATSRFRLLSPGAAVATLTLFTAVALAVAAIRRLPSLAWLVTLGAIPTAVALMLVGERLAAPALYLVLLGVATLWLGYILDWVALRWPVAIAADLTVVAMAFRAVRQGTVEGPRAALLIQFVLMALYLGSIATRTLGLRRAVVPFEVVQTAAAIAIGLGGAVFVAVRSGMGAGGFGAAAMALGAAAYAVAFAFVERQQKAKGNFYFYTSVAIVLVLAGTGLLLGPPALAMVWGVLAILTGWLARGQRRLTLSAHGAAYAMAAALSSGLVSHATETLIGSPASPWTGLGALGVAVLLAVAASATLTGTASTRTTYFERAVQLLLFATLALSAAGAFAGWLVPPLAGRPGAAFDAGMVATVRTAVLVCGVLFLAWVGRFQASLEAGWLAYPLLVAIGLKILLEDLPRGRPATLFPSFAFCGLALIFVPRLRSRRTGRPTAPGGGNASEKPGG